MVDTLTASRNSTTMPFNKKTIKSLVEKFGNAATSAIRNIPQNEQGGARGGTLRASSVSLDAGRDRGSSQGSTGIDRAQSQALSTLGVDQDRRLSSLELLLARANVAGSLEALTESEAHYLLFIYRGVRPFCTYQTLPKSQPSTNPANYFHFALNKLPTLSSF